MTDETSSRWGDAVLAAAALATDPSGLRGIVVRGRVGSLRDVWLEQYKALSDPGAPLRRLPVHVTSDRLIGGLDLVATLNAGRPVAEQGILAQSDGGTILAAFADRMSASTAAIIANVLDRREVALEREGLALLYPARFTLIAFDEGTTEDECPPSSLTDRLAIHLSLDDLARDESASFCRADVEGARKRLDDVVVDGALIEALDATASQFGVASLNASFYALRLARVVAALAGRLACTAEDAAAAARLVLAPRATAWPVEPPADAQDPASPPDAEEHQTSDIDSAALQEMMVAATKAAIPKGLLEAIRGRNALRKGGAAGRSGHVTKSERRGRPSGTRPGQLRGDARLNIIETLRAAAPWQKLRLQMRRTGTTPRGIDIRPDDFRIKRLKHKAETATIFVVDASGSTAVSRLAEAKGAIELLLADCYVRRDQVALIAFGGRGSELLLPPTRSLARAKRDLADLPGGGGTPLAAGIAAAAGLADKLRRKGQSPMVVLLTDGRANLALDGRAERARAMSDALSAASALKVAKVTSLLIDTCSRQHQDAARVAEAMGARYLPLPNGNSQSLSDAVRSCVRDP